MNSLPSILLALLSLKAFAATVSRVCGTVVRRTAQRNCSVTAPDPGGHGRDGCSRSYRLYVPKLVCAAADANASAGGEFEGNASCGGNGAGGDDDSGGGGARVSVLPLLFALHCFRCTTDHMVHFAAVAEHYSFVLVVPAGLWRSWDARYCCGYALKNEIDDRGFLRQIVEELTGELPFVRKDLVYAVGWSNGGYMATHGAGSIFRAVAPISGHVYDGLESLVTAGRPVGLFMHHSSDDHVVAFGGCCNNASMPRCCCRISDISSRCVSAMDVFVHWSRLNGCVTVETSLRDHKRDIMCYTGSSVDGELCRANTTLCVHRHGGHFRPSLAQMFPMTEEIGDFFARDACEAVAPQGMWEAESRMCSCPVEAACDGVYCLGHAAPGDFQPLDKAQKLRPGQQPEPYDVIKTVAVGTSTGLVMGVILIAARLAWLKVRYRGWTLLSNTSFDRNCDGGGLELSEY